MTGNIFQKVSFLLIFRTSCKSQLKWNWNAYVRHKFQSKFFPDLFWSVISGWINLLSQHHFEQYFGMNRIILSKPECYHVQNAFNVYPILYIFILHCNLKDRSSFCLTQAVHVYYPELCKFQLFFRDISVTLL